MRGKKASRSTAGEGTAIKTGRGSDVLMVSIDTLRFPTNATQPTVGSPQLNVCEGARFMPAVRSVLVIGAGAAGTATAILLAEKGVSIDLVDVKPDVGALGSGITLQGNARRGFR